MASLPRGCLFNHHHAFVASRVFSSANRLTLGQSRFFTLSLHCRASSQAATTHPKNHTSPLFKAESIPSSSSPATLAPSRYAFIKSLAAKQSPTIIYEAPPQFWFYFGCWTSGLSILAWTALTGPNSIHQPEGIPQWVGYVFGTSYVLLGAMGFFLISKTPNIVSTIRFMPYPKATATNRAVGSTAAPKLEFTIKRMLPIFQPKVFTAELENVKLKSRFSLPEEYLPQLRRLELQRAEEARQAELHKFDMNHLLTMPFRRIGRLFASFFRGVRAAWTDMGYKIIKVDGKEYKVDVSSGFAHDNFRTLERLVMIE